MKMLLCILSVAAVCDFFNHQIPNRLVAFMLGVGIVNNALLLTPISVWIGWCLLLFSAGIVLYRMRVLGAGDVKVIAVLPLYIGSRSIVLMILAMLISSVWGMGILIQKKMLRQRLLKASYYLMSCLKEKNTGYQYGIKSSDSCTVPVVSCIWLANVLFAFLDG